MEHVTHSKLLTMQEAMDFLTDKGFPCRSRSTFYKILEHFNIPYTNMNPGGQREVRRFALTELEKFLISQGLEV